MRERRIAVGLFCVLFCFCIGAVGGERFIMPKTLTVTKACLMDKIKGGWAGQTIGVTYGGPTEFCYRSVMIPDSVVIPWEDNCIADMMRRNPGLYDDIYMDLTFVEVFDRLGVDAPVDSLANAFADAGYNLWHANQAARYNIKRGIRPPMSGHWKNNPHADDIDYQIEADFAGLMSPAMPNSASEISDRVGHIMNYGDGWYGGVYMGAMYSLAFVTSDIETIVTEALRTIPRGTFFRRCMEAVIESWRQHPDNWKETWQMLLRDWNSEDYGCSEGALDRLNISATINSAYVIMGLLYGGGDFAKTLDISTRCGQDSDCNPASAGGILGTAIGYDAIPEYWLKPLRAAEDIDFKYTASSMSRTYEMSFSQALEMIRRGGGKVTDNSVTIRCQRPRPVRREVSFEGIVAKSRQRIDVVLEAPSGGEARVETGFDAVCRGITVCGAYYCGDRSSVARLALTVDGVEQPIVELPASYHDRKFEIYWNYSLPRGAGRGAEGDKHSFTLRWLNPVADAKISITDAVLYDKK